MVAARRGSVAMKGSFHRAGQAADRGEHGRGGRHDAGAKGGRGRRGPAARRREGWQRRRHGRGRGRVGRGGRRGRRHEGHGETRPAGPEAAPARGRPGNGRLQEEAAGLQGVDQLPGTTDVLVTGVAQNPGLPDSAHHELEHPERRLRVRLEVARDADGHPGGWRGRGGRMVLVGEGRGTAYNARAEMIANLQPDGARGHGHLVLRGPQQTHE